MNELLNLDNPTLWALAVGFFSPPAISVIQQSQWSGRTLVAAVTAFVLGLLTQPTSSGSHC